MSLLEEVFWGAGTWDESEHPWAMVAAGWDEADHPRHPAGSETGGQFRKLYHGTSRDRVEAIKREGLRTDVDPRYPQTRPGSVYLFDDPGQAHVWAGNKYGRKAVVFEVEAGETTPDLPEMGEGAVMSGPIPAERVSQMPIGFQTKRWRDAIEAFEPTRLARAEEGQRRWVEQLERNDIEVALQSWVGDPSTMRIHMGDEVDGIPASPGPAQGMRRQAKALLQAVREGSTNDKRLYRGAVKLDDLKGRGLPESWTESKAVASAWAKKYKGEVFTLEPGQGRGIRMRDYIQSGQDVNSEKQWLIDPWSRVVIAAGYDESEHPRWPAGHPLGGKWRPKDEFLGAEPVKRFRQLLKLDWPGHPAWVTKDGRYALVGDDDEGDYRKEYQVLFDPDGGLNDDLTRGTQMGWVNSQSEGQLMVNDLVSKEDVKDEIGELPSEFGVTYNEETKQLVIGAEVEGIDWEARGYTEAKTQTMAAIRDQVQRAENAKYEDQLSGQERIPVKVGDALRLRAWMQEHYHLGHASEFVFPDGSPVRITDPRLVAIEKNWGNFTESEMYFLSQELNRQIADAKSVSTPIFDEAGNQTGYSYKNTMSGFLSGDYAKEMRYSTAKERGEAKRLIDSLDKAYYTQTFGEEEARRVYPELFETKTKPKIDPRSQGIPDVYLSEKGTFKPGYDAKAKSDLVASAMGWYPKEMKPGELSAETKAAAIAEWKGRNPGGLVSSDGTPYTDEQLVGIALRDINDPSRRHEYTDAIRKQVRADTQSRWRDALLHRFEPEEAHRILEERGWTKFLRQKEDKFKVTPSDPTREDVVAREIAERNWGDALVARGHQYEEIRNWTNAMAEFEPGLVQKLTSRGGNVHYGPGPSTDQDDMYSLYNETGGGWGNTHLDKVQGFYSPSSKSVVMGTAGRGGSANVTAHEVGHMIGNVLGVDESDRLYEFHKKLYPQLDTYFRQQGRGGSRGRKELWAEGVGVVMENRARKRRGLEPTTNSGPFKGHPKSTWNPPTEAEALQQAEYYEWVDAAIRRLDELPDEAFQGWGGTKVAPPGWKWRKDAILGINVLEPE